MKILFTDYFLKNLGKIKSVSKDDIKKLLKKYPNSSDLKKIDKLEDYEVIKGYLLFKKIRILVLFQFVKGKFLPISIVKKESSKGNNIMKNNYINLFGNDIDKILLDIENNKFIEEKLF